MVPFIGFAAILAVAVTAVVAFSVSASMIGYGLLKTTAKFGAFSTIDIPNTPPIPPPGTWAIQYSRNMPPQMTKAPDGTYYFDFPVGQDGVHYVVEKAPPVQLGQTVTLSFNLSGTGIVVPTQGTTAYVTLYLQRAGDNMSGTGAYEFYRFWAGATKLMTGDSIVSVPLTYDRWTGVMGKNDQNGFASCLANLQTIGFTFGDPGAGATGHGAYAKDGPVRFTLKSFTIA